MAVAQRSADCRPDELIDQKNNESPAGRHPAMTARYKRTPVRSWLYR